MAVFLSKLSRLRLFLNVPMMIILPSKATLITIKINKAGSLKNIVYGPSIVKMSHICIINLSRKHL